MRWFHIGGRLWKWFWMLTQVRYKAPLMIYGMVEIIRAFLLAEEDSLRIPDVSLVEASAELLYGLVHQRYILTRAGLHAMVSLLCNLTRSPS